LQEPAPERRAALGEPGRPAARGGLPVRRRAPCRL